MKTQKKHYKVPNGEVQLAVSETGQGQTLLFFNGGGATQGAWKRIIGELKGSYRLVTFDFRNHGKTTTSHNTSLESFLTDAEAMMDKVARSTDSGRLVSGGRPGCLVCSEPSGESGRTVSH